jgi:hypothetical protein
MRIISSSQPALPKFDTVEIFLRLLLVAIFAVPSHAFSGDAAASAGRFEGSFDKLEVGTLGGWAWDGSQPNTPIKVEIYDGSTLLATVIAEGFREDLKAAGKGDGRHAFNYALPQNLRNGQPHTISIKYAGTKSDLPGSPKTLTFPKS